MMKRLLTGTAIAAALAIAGPLWAQTATTPSATGTPSSAYQSGMTTTQPSGQQTQTYGQQAAPSGQQTQTYGQQAAPSGQQTQTYGQQAMPKATTNAAPEATAGSAMQAMPRHHAMRGSRTGRHHVSARVSASRRTGGQMRDNIADQLNREEANRVSSSGSSTPPQGVPAQTQPMQQR